VKVYILEDSYIIRENLRSSTVYAYFGIMSKGELRNIKLRIEYEGTGFSGWQRQPRLRTVQAEIEGSLKKIIGEEVKLIGAGRTDVGVHALGQVANFTAQSVLPLKAIKDALNSLLPRDIVIKGVREVPLRFNARFDAQRRRYRYRYYMGRTALKRNFVCEVPYNFDVTRMNSAANILLGEKDFSSFCHQEKEEKNMVCQVFLTKVRKRGREVTFIIEANRFLHNMVRILAGTLLDVGRGRISVRDFQEVLQSKERRNAGSTAPAKGLCLAGVRY